MSNLTVISTNLSAPAVTNLVTALGTPLGHTVSSKLESSITSSSELAQDLLVCIESSENNTTLAADLNTHLTANVPLLLLSQDIASTYSRTALACLLGVLANLRTGTGGGPSSVYEFTDDHQDIGATDAYLTATSLFIHDADDNHTRLATSKTQYAGTALMNNADGGVMAMSYMVNGTARIAPIGGTFPERVLYMGIMNGEQGFTHLGLNLLETAVNWCLGIYPEPADYPI